MKKKRFYEKKGYSILNVVAIIVLIVCGALNYLGIMSKITVNIIYGFILLILAPLLVYMFWRTKKDKKLRNESQNRKPKVSVEPTAGPFAKPGDAIIDIDGFKYFIKSPFTKEGTTPKTSDTFYSYLSSLHLLEPIAKKMIKWFKGDMGLSDTLVDEDYLCYCFRDLRVFDSSNPLFLFYTRNEKMRLIVAIELLKRNAEARGLEHVSALINTASAHERKYYAGYELLDAFDLFKNGEMTPKVFKKGKSIGYCFLYKN